MRMKAKEETLMVENIGNGYRVTNFTKGSEYKVTLVPLNCTCPSFKFRRQCKHIDMVKRIAEKERKEEEQRHKGIAVERTEDLLVLD
jgi:hypothetical protein